MSEPITPVITDAGLQACFNAANDGLQCVISHIAFGDGQWTPDQTATALASEQQRIPVAEGAAINDKQIRVVGLVDDGGVEYWINEIGFFLDDGTLLAIWADPEKPIAWKSRAVDVYPAFDLVLETLPPDSVTVAVTVDPSSLQLAEEFTQMATAQIQEMLRGMKAEQRLYDLELAVATL